MQIAVVLEEVVNEGVDLAVNMLAVVQACVDRIYGPLTPPVDLDEMVEVARWLCERGLIGMSVAGKAGSA